MKLAKKVKLEIEFEDGSISTQMDNVEVGVRDIGYVKGLKDIIIRENNITTLKIEEMTNERN